MHKYPVQPPISLASVGSEAGLLRWYKLNEGAGSTILDSSNHYNTTASGSPVWSSAVSSPQPITPSLILSDVDDTAIATGATIAISSGLTAGDLVVDLLPAAFLVVLPPTTLMACLTFTGSTTVANYQSMLRAVVFSSSSDNPTITSATRTITYSVTDSNASCCF